MGYRDQFIPERGDISHEVGYMKQRCGINQPYPMLGCWMSILFYGKVISAKIKSLKNLAMAHGNLFNGYQPIRTRQISLR